ncbi:MAG: DUF302 domain-containing protein [Thiohalocapsa sp.]|jgi:uncharacterized protein (DUF302 family)|nr:DUF302 domain-containing protein [Thiohalocapsa sp.]
MLANNALRMAAAALAILLAGCDMGSVMIEEERSPLGFDATVAKIIDNAEARGWEAPKVFDFQASLIAHQRPDPGRMSVIKLCSPNFASRMFASDDSKFVAVMAPCSIAVYEKSDGHTYVSRMNMSLMSKLMGNGVGPVLADIAADDEAILGFVR